MEKKDSWELLMEFFMMIIAGAVGGFVVLISIDEKTINFAKPFLILIYSLFGYASYYLFYKASVMNK